MGKLIDLTGKKVGSLLVIERNGYDNWKRVRWKCQCDCGEIFNVLGQSLRISRDHGCKKCLRTRILSIGNKTYGESKTRLYRVWYSMKHRCYFKSNKSYKHYGGKGISVCDEWLNDYLEFKKWALSTGYNGDLTIDRKFNDGDYCPSNCQWLPRSENCVKRDCSQPKKLNKADIFYIKEKLLAGIKQKDIAVDLGVSAVLISLVNTNKYAVK